MLLQFYEGMIFVGFMGWLRMVRWKVVKKKEVSFEIRAIKNRGVTTYFLVHSYYYI